MENITNAQDIAAIWFIVFFGVALLAPVYGWTCKKVWNLGRKNGD
jgi:hypothetical protein